MHNFSTFAPRSGRRPTHRLRSWVLVPCLLLLNLPFALNAQQSCVHVDDGPPEQLPNGGWRWTCKISITCNCGATVNSGYCGKCVLEAALEVDGCIHGGACWNCGYAQDVADGVWNGCMAGLTPPPPPPPTPPSSPPLACGPQLEVRHPVPLSRRFGALGAPPLAASSS